MTDFDSCWCWSIFSRFELHANACVKKKKEELQGEGCIFSFITFFFLLQTTAMRKTLYLTLSSTVFSAVYTVRIAAIFLVFQVFRWFLLNSALLIWMWVSQKLSLNWKHFTLPFFSHFLHSRHNQGLISRLAQESIYEHGGAGKVVNVPCTSFIDTKPEEKEEEFPLTVRLSSGEAIPQYVYITTTTKKL